MKKHLLLLALSTFLLLAADSALDRRATAQSPAAAAALPFSPMVKAGNFIFVSGNIGIDPATGQLAGAEIAAQTAQALKNIEALLKTSGSGMNEVVKTTVFLKNIEDYAKMNEVYAGFFSGQKPARSTVQVAGLVRGALIEIEAIALRSGFMPAKP